MVGAIDMRQVDELGKYTMEVELAGLANGFGCYNNAKRCIRNCF